MPTEHIAVLEEARSALITVRNVLHTDEAKAAIADRISAYDAAIALMRGQSEPVAWQRRLRRHGATEWTPWRDCSEDDYKFYREHKGNSMAEAETRILIVAPPAAKQERDDA